MESKLPPPFNQREPCSSQTQMKTPDFIETEWWLHTGPPDSSSIEKDENNEDLADDVLATGGGAAMIKASLFAWLLFVTKVKNGGSSPITSNLWLCCLIIVIDFIIAESLLP